MSIQSFAQDFSNWSDLVSLILISITIFVNKLDPVFPLWGNSFHKAFLRFLTMATLIAFSLFRFIFEGLHSTPAPREFLAISVIYFARWMYHYISFRRSTAVPHRLLESARAVSKLVTLRYGRSTDPERRGDPEIVLRSGVRTAEGEHYWRGKVQEKHQHGKGWEIRLVEEGMNNDFLSALGTVEYAASEKASLIDFYGKIYQTVLNVEGAGEPHVDWADFLTQYSAIAKTNMAVRANAVGDGDLAGVARRVAADACLYVSGKYPSRIATQVELINQCVYKAAAKLARELRDADENGE